MEHSLRSFKNALRARRAARARPSGVLRRGRTLPTLSPSLVRDLAPERAVRHRWCRPYPRLRGAYLRWPAGFIPLLFDNYPRTKPDGCGSTCATTGTQATRRRQPSGSPICRTARASIRSSISHGSKVRCRPMPTPCAGTHRGSSNRPDRRTAAVASGSVVVLKRRIGVVQNNGVDANLAPLTEHLERPVARP